MVSVAYPNTLKTINLTSLCELTKGESGHISVIEGEELKLALLQLGITEGDECTFTGVAPFRDPISIMVNRTKITIRKRDAARIWIKRK